MKSRSVITGIYAPDPLMGILAKERGDRYFSGCYIFAINKEVKHELLENREGWENPIAP